MHNVVMPYYQPIVRLDTRAVAFYEALARHRCGGDEHVRLLALGEEYGFVHLVDLGILSQVTQLLSRNLDLVVSVNVSVRTLDTALGEYLSAVYRNLRVADRLIFEITETVSIRNKRNVSLFVDAVRLLGARLAVDDLGDGFSSMELVADVRPDFVKLPASAFARYNNDPVAFSRVRKLIEGLGGIVIVEYVNSLARVKLLRSAGVELGQGHFFGLPSAEPLPIGAHVVLSTAPEYETS